MLPAGAGSPGGHQCYDYGTSILAEVGNDKVEF